MGYFCILKHHQANVANTLVEMKYSVQHEMKVFNVYALEDFA